MGQSKIIGDLCRCREDLIVIRNDILGMNYVHLSVCVPLNDAIAKLHDTIKEARDVFKKQGIQEMTGDN